MNVEPVYEDMYGINISTHKNVLIGFHKDMIKLECATFKNLQGVIRVHVIYNNILYVLSDTIYIHNLKKDKANGIRANGIKIKMAGPIKNPFGFLVSEDNYIYILRMSEFSIFETKVKCNCIHNEENKLICAEGKQLKTYKIKE